MEKRGNKTLIICMTESDAHVVALKLLDIYLSEEGWLVNNLGVCTPLKECMQVAAEESPMAIVMGTQNGHAITDLSRLRELRCHYGVVAPVILGGNVSLGARRGVDTETELKRLGVDEVICDFEVLNRRLHEISRVLDVPLQHAV